MQTRREFLRSGSQIAAGALLMPAVNELAKPKRVGVQLYSVRDDMLKDAVGTLRQLAKIGYTDLESARSPKGNFYGLKPKEIKKIANELGMVVRSGHVHVDKNWERSIEGAVEAGQQYLVCSSLPHQGQTIDNYKRCADIFSKAGEDCKKANLVFAYHNHEEEFEKKDGQVLYDILLDRSDKNLVKMQMDLGWVIISGNDPVAYFRKYPGRFPLWHLKDMDVKKKHSTEFGKGNLDVKSFVRNADKYGLKYYFVEQEEYSMKPLESLRYDFNYLKRI